MLYKKIFCFGGIALEKSQEIYSDNVFRNLKKIIELKCD